MLAAVNAAVVALIAAVLIDLAERYRRLRERLAGGEPPPALVAEARAAEEELGELVASTGVELVVQLDQVGDLVTVPVARRVGEDPIDRPGRAGGHLVVGGVVLRHVAAARRHLALVLLAPRRRA